MTHPDRAIEAGARVCYEKFNEGLIRDIEIEWPDMPQDFKERMIEAFSAGVTALAAEGLVVVPGDLARKVTSIARRNEDAPEIHELSAMITAAQEQNDARPSPEADR